MLINPSLDNIKTILAARANPHANFKSILVAGTNGKGSVCTFLELLYRELLPDVKVGKYISPHLVSIRERFSINAEDIDPVVFDRCWTRYITDRSGLTILTPFEKETLFAFEYFSHEHVDVAILEVGLGGRWDATNVVRSEDLLATAITNVSMDHMEYLGDTLDQIRQEKQGIIRPQVPHFNGDQIESTESNPNARYGANFLLACKIFEETNSIIIPEETKSKILAKFPHRYRARLELDRQARTLVDIAHNEASMANLNNFIKQEINPHTRKIFVLAMLDKDYQNCIKTLFEGIINSQDLVIICEPNNPRKTAAEDLAKSINEHFTKLETSIIKNPEAAIMTAFAQQNPDDYLIITGTSSIMKNALDQLETKQRRSHDKSDGKYPSHIV